MFALAVSSGVAITDTMLEPIVDYIVGNLAVIVPVGITIMGIMMGIGLIPKVLGKFTA